MNNNSSDSDKGEYKDNSQIINLDFEIQQLDKNLKRLENPTKNVSRCEICKKELKSYMHAKTHYISSLHKKTFQEVKNNRIKDILKKLQYLESTYCKVCDKCVLPATIKSLNKHLSSNEHEKNLKSYCFVCDILTASEKDFEEHKNHSLAHWNKIYDFENELSQNKEQVNDSSNNIRPYYCTKCDVTFFPGEFINHQNQFCHLAFNVLYTMYSKDFIKKHYSVINDEQYLMCYLCDQKVFSVDLIESHLISSNHKHNVRKEFSLVFSKNKSTENKNLSPKQNIDEIEKKLQNQKTERKKVNSVSNNNLNKSTRKTPTSINNTNKSTENKNLSPKQNNDEIEKKIQNQKKGKKKINSATNNKRTRKKSSINNTDRFYCYLCKMEFENEILHNVHCLSFPHLEMSKWKSEAVSMGVLYAEYWVRSNNFLTCTLCDVETFTSSSFKAHNEKINHRMHFSEWCQAFASWNLGETIDPKYFYCKPCNLPLSGTTKAENHYKNPQHLISQKFYCSICQVANSSKRMSLEHQMSDNHKENMFLDNLDNNLPQDSFDAFHEPIEVSKINGMESQIFEEMEKLVDTLYYSKTVPSEVALQYLKRINLEVAELKQKYEKAGETILYSIGQELQNNDTKKYKFESFISNNHTGEGLLRDTIENKPGSNTAKQEN